MQFRYEILILAVPDITQDDVKLMEGLLADTISKARGSVLSFERWGKYELSYPIKSHEYGVYYLMRYDVPSATEINNDIRLLFSIRLGGFVIRLIISKVEGKSLEYQRPRSLEEAPTTRESSFQYQRDRRSFNDSSGNNNHGGYQSDSNQAEIDDSGL